VSCSGDARRGAISGDGGRIPGDFSSGVAFDGKEVLVTNESSILNDPQHYAIFPVNDNENRPLAPVAPG
jgi:hypothetical protein